MSYPNSPEKIGIADNPIVYSLYSINNISGSYFSNQDFLLMDGSFFLLMDGGNFLLMGT